MAPALFDFLVYSGHFSQAFVIYQLVLMVGLINLSDFAVFCFAVALPVAFLLTARHFLKRAEHPETTAPTDAQARPPSPHA